MGRNVCILVDTGEAIPSSATFLTTTPSASYRVLFLTAEETGCSCPQPGTSAASSATLSPVCCIKYSPCSGGEESSRAVFTCWGAELWLRCATFLPDALALAEAWELSALCLCECNEKGDLELPPCPSAGVDGEELQVDSLLHTLEGKAGWSPVAGGGRCCRKGRSHLLILGGSLSVCCLTCCAWLTFKCFPRRRKEPSWLSWPVRL